MFLKYILRCVRRYQCENLHDYDIEVSAYYVDWFVLYRFRNKNAPRLWRTGMIADHRHPLTPPSSSDFQTVNDCKYYTIHHIFVVSDDSWQPDVENAYLDRNFVCHTTVRSYSENSTTWPDTPALRAHGDRVYGSVYTRSVCSCDLNNII